MGPAPWTRACEKATARNSWELELAQVSLVELPMVTVLDWPPTAFTTGKTLIHSKNHFCGIIFPGTRDIAGIGVTTSSMGTTTIGTMIITPHITRGEIKILRVKNLFGV